MRHCHDYLLFMPPLRAMPLRYYFRLLIFSLSPLFFAADDAPFDTRMAYGAAIERRHSCYAMLMRVAIMLILLSDADITRCYVAAIHVSLPPPLFRCFYEPLFYCEGTLSALNRG